LRTLVVSDVSLGYGTPQILRLANSVAGHYGGEVLVVEPDQPERPRIADLQTPSNVRIERLYTSHTPYWGEGLIEFILATNRLVESYSPDLFIGAAHIGMRVCATAALRQDAVKVFYCLEDTGVPWLDDCIIPRASEMWDLVIFPEENRAMRYSAELQLKPSTHVAIMYNANEPRMVLPVGQRNGRLFYGGLVHKESTLARYFPETPDVPIDVFGNIVGYDTTLDYVKRLNPPDGPRYGGYLKADDSFFKSLASYCYSIVGWVPLRYDYHYAAPNKFFDAVACGVPPICAPHPQCVDLIGKWNCGLLMEDWSLESFRRTSEAAIEAIGSDFHLELVENCRRAMRQELSWDCQFNKLVPLLDRLLKRAEVA
jgi:hypothetical protein